MKYFILLSILIISSCQVNFNLFPKFEGKKKNDPAKVTSISPDQWKGMAEIALPRDQPATLEAVKLPKVKDVCTHTSIVATKKGDDFECACWNCGKIYECLVVEFVN